MKLLTVLLSCAVLSLIASEVSAFTCENGVSYIENECNGCACSGGKTKSIKRMRRTATTSIALQFQVTWLALRKDVRILAYRTVKLERSGIRTATNVNALKVIN